MKELIIELRNLQRRNMKKITKVKSDKVYYRLTNLDGQIDDACKILLIINERTK